MNITDPETLRQKREVSQTKVFFLSKTYNQNQL